MQLKCRYRIAWQQRHQLCGCCTCGRCNAAVPCRPRCSTPHPNKHMRQCGKLLCLHVKSATNPWGCCTRWRRVLRPPLS